MGIGKVLGTLSPVYGAITGEGAFGKMISPGKHARLSAGEGLDQQEIINAEVDRQLTERAGRNNPQPVGMKKGGKVKKMARGGGVESRGKTRGRFV